jgi:hypothetical protein
LSPRRFTGFLIGKRPQENIYCKYRETEKGRKKGGGCLAQDKGIKYSNEEGSGFHMIEMLFRILRDCRQY